MELKFKMNNTVRETKEKCNCSNALVCRLCLLLDEMKLKGLKIKIVCFLHIKRYCFNSKKGMVIYRYLGGLLENYDIVNIYSWIYTMLVVAQYRYSLEYIGINN